MPLISKVAAQRRLPLRLQKATRRQRQALLKLPSPSPKPRRQRQRLAAPVVPATAEICQKANVPIKKYLLTGLLVWLPIAITIWVLLWVVGLADGILMGFLTALQTLSPDIVSGYLEQFKHIPGLGVLIVFTGLLLTGSLVSNVAGRWWLTQWDRLLTNIPVFKTIYNSVKKVSDTLFSSNGNAFRTALLVQYPRPGSWTIAFQTGSPGGEVARHLGPDFVSVYVPTTPNPTSGFFLMLPRADVIELKMSVDEALTYVISMGSVAPGASAGVHSK